MYEMDPFLLALSRFRRRKFDDTVDICTHILDQNPYDQAVWFLKCRALTEKNFIDDLDVEEEGVADLLLDENAVHNTARPGTSLARPLTGGTSSGGPNQLVRPMTQSGRPVTGFARPGTSRPGTNGSLSVEAAMSAGRPGTSRPITSGGRFVRLGTASMISDGGQFIHVDKLDLKKYAQRPAIAKALVDYILYYDHNPKKALELAAEATVACNYEDWWWKARLGKCYYQLGLYRDAEKQFRSALKHQEMITTHLELAKVYIKIDQPNTALEIYTKASEKFVGETHLLLGMARIYEQLNDSNKAIQIFKKVLHFDSCNPEAIACLASHHFYTDQPEVALRFYRRLVQMGINNAELWNNLGLCCFYASQYDMCLSCFERALALADDSNMADVWYNIGQVAIGIGDLGLAYQAFKISVSIDAHHSESFNNLGVLELRKNNFEMARSNFATAMKLSEFLFEPFFNGALLSFKLGDFQESHELALKSVGCFPDHSDSKDLLKQLKQHFSTL
eukprot:GILI01021941.1.p1 GENE.GILI01021941.1~~GILI01021941.1.p1  ORF type:complete len:520 (-),score=157.53 GILI01021941.1:66-1583(-)